ncbi:MAG: TetR/AcrR family transcriptional regulator [Gammaproteobacteria bacterium]|nr:TetR/AcrR family transcriptional regulator [Gammaproteobacteria bacterium]MDH5730697.1 TetR/AcrR family transcriptional regulator [Gammaproteobacteria bacterium]
MPKKSKDSYHHGDLRQALIDAAIVLLRERGINDLSLREVAKRAGVSHTAPYRHFNDKHALLCAIAAVGFKRLADAMQQCIAQDPQNPLKQLQASGLAYVRLAVQYPDITHLMFGGALGYENLPADLIEVSDAAFGGLLQIIDNGKQAGLYQDEDTMSLALVVWSSVHGLSMLISAGKLQDHVKNQDDVDCMAELVTRFLLSGIKSDKLGAPE